MDQLPVDQPNGGSASPPRPTAQRGSFAPHGGTSLPGPTMVERIDLAASRPSRTVTGMVGRPTVYGVSVTYTVEVTDRSALMAEAFERFCGKLRPGEKVTAWHFEQWQRWGR